MHENNAALLRQIVQRLVHAQLAALRALPPPGSVTLCDQLAQAADALNHPHPLVAVVGYTSASKAAILNALVGAILFPAGEDAASELPFLIRHTPGQSEPALLFDNPHDLNALLGAVANRIDTPDASSLRTQAAITDNLERIRPLLNSKVGIAQRYQGAEALYAVRRSLNSLIRLARALSIEIPPSLARPGEGMPTIELAFACLSQGDARLEKLSLLDVPSLRTGKPGSMAALTVAQLKAASATLALLDTSLTGGEPPPRLRQSLTELATLAPGRLFVLVDGAAPHSSPQPQKAVQPATGTRWLDDALENTAIFSVDAARAYLANRARHEIALHGKLPNAARHNWVKDFGMETMGSNWSSQIRSESQLQSAIQSLWLASQFDAPLSILLQTALAQSSLRAAVTAVDCLARLAAPIRELNPDTRIAESDDFERTRQQLAELHADRERLDRLKQLSSQAQAVTLHLIRSRSHVILKRYRAVCTRALEHYFREGKALAIAAPAPRLPDGQLHYPRLGRDAPPAIHPHAPPPARGILQIRERSHALKVLCKIGESLECIVKSAQLDILRATRGALAEFNTGMTQRVASEMQRPQPVKARMHLPPAGDERWQGAPMQALLDTLEETSVVHHGVRRKRGLWGTVCKGLRTAQWGWEQHTVHEDVFEISLERLRLCVNQSFQAMQSGFDTLLAREVGHPIEACARDIVNALKQEVESGREQQLHTLLDDTAPLQPPAEAEERPSFFTWPIA